MAKVTVTKKDDGTRYKFTGAGPLRTSLTDRVQTFLRKYPAKRYDYHMHLQPFGLSTWTCAALVDLPKSTVMKLLDEFNARGGLHEISITIYESAYPNGVNDGRIFISADVEYSAGGDEE